MNRRTQIIGFSAILTLASFLSGCEPSNEQRANIQGKLPTDNLTPQERKERQQGIANTQGGYPKGGSSTPSNKRTH